MKPRLKNAAFGLVSALLVTPAALAADHMAGKSVSKPEAQRDVGGEFPDRSAEYPSREAQPYAAPTGDAAREAFTLVGRTRDGKEVRKAPSDELIRALSERSSGEAKGDVDVQPDPVAGKGERMVVGKDGRTRVTNTKTYPYSAIGYLDIQDANDPNTYYMCTAVLIGPKTLITAASCLYQHDYNATREVALAGKPGAGNNPGGGDSGEDDGGNGGGNGGGDNGGGGAGGGGGEQVQEGRWNEKFTFWPALNGKDDAPFGSFEYDTAYVFEGYLTQFDGTYGSVMPYDVGVITLQQPIGDDIGYLGYWAIGDKDLANMEVNLAAYNTDKKPEFTMWSAKCKIDKQAIFETVFAHTCDTDDFSAPMFVYDKKEDSRYVVGINVATYQNQNVAVRLYGPIYDWLSTVGTEQ